MKLEEAIHQKEFQSEAHKAMINLLFTAGYLSGILSNIISRHGITRQQYNMLRILRGQHPGGTSINLIRDRMVERMPDCSRMVDRLLAKGLITKCSSQHDRRAANISITEEGLNLLAAIDPAVQATENMFESFAPGEIKQLNDLLDKMRS